MGWQEMMIHLKRNWPAKILSLLAAIVMWFFIMRDQNPVMEVSYTVPVQVQNLAANYIIEDAPQYVRVTLSGSRDTIINLKSENLKAYIDASGVSTGQNNVTIHFNPPSGMNIVEIKPDTVTINVDEFASKKLPVEIVPIGQIPDNVALKSVTVIPKEVTVSGRKQQVMAATRVVMKVNVAGQTKNFSAVADLEAWDNAGNVLVGQVADGYEVKGITIKPVQVTITGREEMVDTVSELKTESIDISNATTPIDGTYNIVIPDGLTSKMTTVHVTVDIQRKA